MTGINLTSTTEQIIGLDGQQVAHIRQSANEFGWAILDHRGPFHIEDYGPDYVTVRGSAVEIASLDAHLENNPGMIYPNRAALTLEQRVSRLEKKWEESCLRSKEKSGQ